MKATDFLGEEPERVVNTFRGRPMQTDYAEKFEIGKQFEEFVARQLLPYGFQLEPCVTREEQFEIGENRFGLEIKRDGLFGQTGNLYIETAERANPDLDGLTPSGIWRRDCCWLFGIGDETEFWIFSKRVLQWFHAALRRGEKVDGVMMDARVRGAGFTISLRLASELCDRIFMDNGTGVWIPAVPCFDEPSRFRIVGGGRR